MPDFIGLGNGLINVVLVLVILVVLVLIHEWGHFIVARRAKVTVHEFGIGFPPRAKVLGTDKHGTEYTLNWLPIGGFVRLEGEEGRSADPHAFINQSLRTRLTILLAGVTMNILLAFVIFTGIAMFGDPAAEVQLTCVQPDGPAAQVGLRSGTQTGTITTPDGTVFPVCDPSGDVITAIDGRRFMVFADPTAPDALSYLRAHAGQQVTLTIRSADGSVRDVPVTLRDPATAAQKGALGITGAGIAYSDVRNDPLTAAGLGARRTVDAALLIVRGLGDFISDLGNPQISGPIGIVNTVGIVRTELPPVFLIWLVGLLSANLGVVNALPFPPLDGGRVAVAIIQRLTGNRVSVSAERLAYLTGFILLMALLAWVTLFDTGVFQRQT
jgi:regulator of sigma E protease